MELRHIPLNELHVATANVRHKSKKPDLSDILPSIRKRGILQPLLVRPDPEGFGIVAGRRRFLAAKTWEQGRRWHLYLAPSCRKATISTLWKHR